MLTTMRRLRGFLWLLAGWLGLVYFLYLCGAPVPHEKRFARVSSWLGTIRRQVAGEEREPARASAAAVTPPKPVGLVLPAKIPVLLPNVIYGVPNEEMSVFFDNIVLSKWSDCYRFEMDCALKGELQRRRWVVVPSVSEIGTHTLSVILRDLKGKELAREKTKLLISPHVRAPAKISILTVGDSITHASAWLNELSRLLDSTGGLDWEMLGTHCPRQALPRVRHEGYGGWTWNRFLTLYEPGSAKLYNREKSPFVYLDKNGPTLDVARYFQEHFSGRLPDVVIFQLGMNDVFCVDPEHPSAMRAELLNIVADAEKLVQGFKKAAPRAVVGIQMPPQFSTSESVFPLRYGAEFTRWRNREGNFAYLQSLVKHFGGRENERIFLVPAYTGVDPIDGYPLGDAGHPDKLGARQFAASVYGWLLFCLDQGMLARNASRNHQ
jgi:lysophospholipase L1-like esterase